jgi:ectoine hydroxylase-related dioxygenase (phytanoyl-CoA dioxygenase family)
MKPFREIFLPEVEPDQVIELLDTEGYILLRNAVPVHETEKLLGSITETLASESWIDRQQSLLDHVAVSESACAEDDDQFKRVYDRVFQLESLHRFPHSPALIQIMQTIVGRELLIHPRHAVRLIFPNFERSIVHAHQDHTAVQGDTRCFTAWMPLHDCPIEMGPLRILSGSHKMGLQATETSGYIPEGKALGTEWVGGDLHAGDLLIFHSLTVHEALPNSSKQIRISLDCRFQGYLQKVNPAVFVFPGSGRRSWDKIYAAWDNNDLKYYWKSLPLQFSPTLQELRVLSETADDPRMRTRYANIYERLLLQDGGCRDDTLPLGYWRCLSASSSPHTTYLRPPYAPPSKDAPRDSSNASAAKRRAWHLR